VKRLQSSKLLFGFLAGILSLVLMGSYQAQAVWTKSENSRVKALEKRILALEEQLASQEEQIASQEVITMRYLATGGSGGTYGDICPGSENLEGPQSSAFIGRLSPKVDGLGNVVTDINGQARQAYVYTCKISFIAIKN
jgi:hypothetical protein